MPFGIGDALLGLTGLGSAFGSLFGGRKQPSMQDLERLFGAGALNKRTNDIYQGMVANPVFRQSQGNINLAGQNLGQGINAALGRAGLFGSGVGAVSSELGNAASGFGLQNLSSNTFNAASDQASQLNNLLAQLFQGTQQGGSPFQTGSAALLSALGPLLAQRFARKPVGSG